MRTAHPFYLQRLKPFLRLLGIALGASVLSLYFFTPHFVRWNGLHIEPAQYTPEVARAVDTLIQLDHPLFKVASPNNVVLRWRLLFPIVGHFLHFPEKVFLLLPFFGCVIALMYTAHVCRRFVREEKQIFFVTALAATSSWFFVSTGWLCYEDSWCVLGMLLVAFSRSRTTLLGCCLLQPFIDERFVLMTPLMLAVRFAARPDDEPPTRFWTDVKIIVSLLVPYVILRVILLPQDRGSLFYVFNRADELRQPVSWTQYLLGFWMGLRLLWIAVGAAIWMLVRSGRRSATIFLSASVAMAIVLSFAIANDWSRTMSSLLPAALLGMLWLIRDFPRPMRWGLPLLLAGNLLLPVWHIVVGINEPIFYCYDALNEYLHPAPELTATHYLVEAQRLARENHPAESAKMIGYAERLDPAEVTRYLDYIHLRNGGRVAVPSNPSSTSPGE